MISFLFCLKWFIMYSRSNLSHTNITGVAACNLNASFNLMACMCYWYIPPTYHVGQKLPDCVWGHEVITALFNNQLALCLYRSD